MTLSCFITAHMAQIVEEWSAFAGTLEPAASMMSELSLRDHAKLILTAIARDLESSQTKSAQMEKSKGWAVATSTVETAAATHGALRHLSGFDLNQLGAEYRALRASVVRLWMLEPDFQMGPAALQDMIRFNEAVDQAIAESTSRYAAELSLSRDMFMAILAHDLRSPLGAIRMLSHLLGTGAATDQARKQAGQIQRSAREMSGMIRDLLEYTRTHLGKGIPVVQAICSVAGICREAVEEVRAGQPERRVILNVPEHLAGFVDSGRLRQALSNLLNNAVQHGAPDLPVTMTAIAGQDGEIVIAVQNFGEPIPADALQIIFDPLVQLRQKSAGQPEPPSTNLGLGLFIAREVALGHQGTLTVTSTRQEGTVFTLLIPNATGPEKLDARDERGCAEVLLDR